MLFFYQNVWIWITISLTFVLKGQINNIPALVQIMTWYRPGNKPLSEPMMFSLLLHIHVTRPQWVRCKSGLKPSISFHLISAFLRRSLVYNENQTMFYTGQSPLTNVSRVITLTNTFNFTLVVHNTSVPSEFRQYFTVSSQIILIQLWNVHVFNKHFDILEGLKTLIEFESKYKNLGKWVPWDISSHEYIRYHQNSSWSHSLVGNKHVAWWS